LTATYANGGTSLTTTTISGGKIFTFSADHGLSVDDEIYWDNSFNGVIADNAYFVETIPANNGAPEAKAIPKHKGKATKKTTRPDARSPLTLEKM
jgi:hypothetical protein